MKIHKKVIYILSFAFIALGLLVIEGNYKLYPDFEENIKKLIPNIVSGQRDFIINALMGVLGSVVVSLIVEIINYHVARKKCILLFLQNASELNVLLENVTLSCRAQRVETAVKRNLYKAILDYNTSDLYSSYHDIDFIKKKNKYSKLLRDIYFELIYVKREVETKRKNILFDSDDVFEKIDRTDLNKYFWEIQEVKDENKVGYQKAFYDKVINQKIQIVENYLFKCVWYAIKKPNDLIDKICKNKILYFFFGKIATLMLRTDVIRWSPFIHENFINLYYQPEYYKYKKIPFTRYKVCYRKTNKTKKNCNKNLSKKREQKILMKNKIKKMFEKYKRNIVSYLTIPHLWVAMIIIVLCLVTLEISRYLNTISSNYWSSIYSNIFAGLLTGLILCLISGVKQVAVSKLKSKKNFLEEISSTNIYYAIQDVDFRLEMFGRVIL